MTEDFLRQETSAVIGQWDYFQPVLKINQNPHYAFKARGTNDISSENN